jgi:hypothetical protein
MTFLKLKKDNPITKGKTTENKKEIMNFNQNKFSSIKFKPLRCFA